MGDDAGVAFEASRFCVAVSVPAKGVGEVKKSRTRTVTGKLAEGATVAGASVSRNTSNELDAMQMSTTRVVVVTVPATPEDADFTSSSSS